MMKLLTLHLKSMKGREKRIRKEAEAEVKIRKTWNKQKQEKEARVGQRELPKQENKVKILFILEKEPAIVLELYNVKVVTKKLDSIRDISISVID
jgi:hypothetical protein